MIHQSSQSKRNEQSSVPKLRCFFVNFVGSEEVADIKQEAFWVFNEVETLAEVQPNLGSYCDEPSIVNTTLKVGEMISNVRL